MKRTEIAGKLFAFDGSLSEQMINKLTVLILKNGGFSLGVVTRISDSLDYLVIKSDRFQEDNTVLIHAIHTKAKNHGKPIIMKAEELEEWMWEGRDGHK